MAGKFPTQSEEIFIKLKTSLVLRTFLRRRAAAGAETVRPSCTLTGKLELLTTKSGQHQVTNGTDVYLSTAVTALKVQQAS